jgi:predicted dehydrogenase
MRLSPEDLALFSANAGHAARVAIVGAGRWGRVWTTVLAEARGGAADLTLVARHNLAEAREWSRSRAQLEGLDVVGSIDAIGAPFAALVASRPRDHVADASAALARGAHVLVEKPMATDAHAARLLIDSAAAMPRVLAVNTEFAFVPSFHQAASAAAVTSSRLIELELDWSDPPDEVRHGEAKRRHEETNLIEDLLPHAVSIFRIFRPDDQFHVVGAKLDGDGFAGSLALSDQRGNTYRLRCSVRAAQRRRHLAVRAEGCTANIDFSATPERVTWSSPPSETPAFPPLAAGTLRLSFGAFLSQALGLVRSTPISAGLHDGLRLQEELSALLHAS